jgi:hypothetical protein
MNLQELMNEAGTQLNEEKVRGYFLGNFTGKKPLDFETTLKEMIGDEDATNFRTELKAIFEETKSDYKIQLSSLLKPQETSKDFLNDSLESLDYFLTGFSSAGAGGNPEIEEVCEDLESFVLDIEELIAKDSVSTEEMDDLKEEILGAWEELVSLKS